MLLGQWIVVGIGAAIGAWLRWGLGLMFNATLPVLALGTLLANLLGGYLIGLAIGSFCFSRGEAICHDGHAWRINDVFYFFC